MKRTAAVLALAIGCGGGKGGDPQDVAACTPEEQEVEGLSLVFEVHDLGFIGTLPTSAHLVTSEAQLTAELGNEPPPELADFDFTNDRLVLGASNPALRFVVEDASGDLLAGEEPLCQGVAPSTVAYVMRGFPADTGNTLSVIGCPYTGPDPCLAP